jgi:hypothetical protein
MSDDIQVGNVNKPVARKPLPKKPTQTTESVATESAVPSKPASDADIAALNAKMEEVLKFLQAIDWKMWVYLKANNYID